MDAFLWFGAFVGALAVVIVARMPLAAGMGLIGIIGTAVAVSPEAVIQIANIAYSQSSSFVLVVAPMFILMGDVIAVSGLGSALFRAAAICTRRLPGGLGIATVIACAGFAAVCGSSAVTAATIGAISVPEMVKHGYKKSLALGAAAAGGTLGILIPPSVPMILYGIITETSIGDLFLAGILPGLMLTVLLSFTIVCLVLLKPELAPRTRETQKQPAATRVFVEATPIIFIAVFIVVALYGGFATPTEVAAVGAGAAILVAMLLGRLRRALLSKALDGAIRTTAMFLLLLIGGLFSSFVLTRLGVPQGMSSATLSAELPPWLFMVLINALFLILGMFLDPMSILVIVVPIFLPSVKAAGFDPVWFGVMVTIQCEIAAITPPVGFNLFVLRTVVPGAELSEVIRGSVIFLIPMLAAIALLVAIPDIALVLPRMAK